MRFVIATLPDIKFNLGRDLDLVKSCALYGDEVVLYSPTYLGTAPLLDFSKKALFLRDARVLHAADPVVYFSGRPQLRVSPQDRFAGTAPWTTCRASAA